MGGAALLNLLEGLELLGEGHFLLLSKTTYKPPLTTWWVWSGLTPLHTVTLTTTTATTTTTTATTTTNTATEGNTEEDGAR